MFSGLHLLLPSVWTPDSVREAMLSMTLLRHAVSLDYELEVHLRT